VRTFIELLAKDGGRLIIDTGAILGVRTAPNKTKTDQGTAGAPVTLILRNAAPVEVICIEPVMVFAQICIVAGKAADLEGGEQPLAIQWLDHADLDADA
jgi:hypothetical protein